MKKRKRGKGFTLVELIVVIAIIAVLAAILVPTMLGLVVKARVTSANNTASEIRKSINLMLLQADYANYGIIPDKLLKFDITVKTTGGDTVWTCSAAQEGAYRNGSSGGITWGSEQSYTTHSGEGTDKRGEKMICAAISEKFPQIKNGAIVIVLKGGSCSFAAFTTEMSTPLPEDQYPPIGTNGIPGDFDWDGTNNGISPDGYIIGTSPTVVIA